MQQTDKGQDFLSQIQDNGRHRPSFFSWKIETVLFFLAEKEKNGFKKKTGGQGRPPLQTIS